MKKLLLGTTALAVAGLMAMPAPQAMAAAAAGTQPIQISVGGGFWGFLLGASEKRGSATGYTTGGALTNTQYNPGHNLTNRQIWDKSWVDFHGIGHFDNGISAGVDIQIRGNNPSALQASSLQTADTIGGAFAFMNLAQYGRMEIGSTAGAARKMWYGAITPLRFAHGFNSPNAVQFGGANPLNQPTTLIDMGNADRAEKINYFTPRVAGFQLGVSYAPNNCMYNNGAFTNGDQNNGGAGANNTATSGSCLFFGNMPSSHVAAEQNDIIEVGANYVGKFDGVDLGTYFGFGHASLSSSRQPWTNSNMRDLEEYGAGANVGYMGFQLGASFRYSNQGNKFGGNGVANTGIVGNALGVTSGTIPDYISPTNRWDLNVGLTYHTGPWAVGGSYGYAQDEEKCGVAGKFAFNGVACSAQGANMGKDKLNDFALGANYAIGPGVNINGGIEYSKYDAFDGNPAATNTNWVYMIGTALYF